MEARASNADYEIGTARTLADLTRRQQEIAMLVGRGLTDQLIAKQLCISIGTVKSHLTIIKDRVGVPKHGGWNGRVLLAWWLWNQER